MNIKLYDDVLLKDGRTAGVVEMLGEDCFLVDVGDGPESWETIEVTSGMIERVL